MSYIFALFIVAGYLAVIYNNRIGFLIQFVGCLGMIYLFAGLDGGVVLVNSIFAVVNIWGFYKWRTH